MTGEKIVETIGGATAGMTSGDPPNGTKRTIGDQLLEARRTGEDATKGVAAAAADSAEIGKTAAPVEVVVEEEVVVRTIGGPGLGVEETIATRTGHRKTAGEEVEAKSRVGSRSGTVDPNPSENTDRVARRVC